MFDGALPARGGNEPNPMSAPAVSAAPIPVIRRITLKPLGSTDFRSSRPHSGTGRFDPKATFITLPVDGWGGGEADN